MSCIESRLAGYALYNTRLSRSLDSRSPAKNCGDCPASLERGMPNSDARLETPGGSRVAAELIATNEAVAVYDGPDSNQTTIPIRAPPTSARIKKACRRNNAPMLDSTA